jgi:hypothetical protein
VRERETHKRGGIGPPGRGPASLLAGPAGRAANPVGCNPEPVLCQKFNHFSNYFK